MLQQIERSTIGDRLIICERVYVLFKNDTIMRKADKRHSIM